MTRKRYDIKCLDRYEFVDTILRYLKDKCSLVLEFEKTERHLKLFKGVIKEKGKRKQVVGVGYGGTRENLRDLPTPLQTELLSFVFKYWNDNSKNDIKVPLLILGYSFDEVFLRKIRLLNTVIPDVRLMQYININNLNNLDNHLDRLYKHYEKMLEDKRNIKNEVIDFHSAIVQYIKQGGEIDGRQYYVLDCEVPAGEGTKKEEVIDILALERKRKWLTAIEVKFSRLRDIRTQSVIFQGLDYCNWVEEHKKALSMLFPQHRINVSRRTRLIIINGPEGFPEFHEEVVKACFKKDRYQEIELYSTNDTLPLEFKENLSIT